MAETKWTKGPWTVEDPISGMLSIVEAGKETYEWRFIASVDLLPADAGDIPPHEARANAHLIKAAPLLYEALERLVSFAESVEAKALVGDEGCLWPCEQARTALSAARGEEG